MHSQPRACVRGARYVRGAAAGPSDGQNRSPGRHCDAQRASERRRRSSTRARRLRAAIEIERVRVAHARSGRTPPLSLASRFRQARACKVRARNTGGRIRHRTMPSLLQNLRAICALLRRACVACAGGSGGGEGPLSGGRVSSCFGRPKIEQAFPDGQGRARALMRTIVSACAPTVVVRGRKGAQQLHTADVGGQARLCADAPGLTRLLRPWRASVRLMLGGRWARKTCLGRIRRKRRTRMVRRRWPVSSP